MNGTSELLNLTLIAGCFLPFIVIAGALLHGLRLQRSVDRSRLLLQSIQQERDQQLMLELSNVVRTWRRTDGA